MELRPRAFLTEDEPNSFICTVSSSIPIRAPLSLDEEADDGSDSHPRIRLSSNNGSSSTASSEFGETSSEISFEADPVAEDARIYLESPKDWIFRPFEDSPGGISSGEEEDLLMEEYEEGLGRVRAVPIARLSMEFDNDDDEEERDDEGSCLVGDDSQPEEVSRGCDRELTEIAVSEEDVADDLSAEGDWIGRGEDQSTVDVNAGSDQRSWPQLLEMRISEDLSKEGAIKTWVFDEEFNEWKERASEIRAGDKALSLEMRTSGGEISALFGAKMSGLLKDADEASMEEWDCGISRVKEVEISVPRSMEVPVRGLDDTCVMNAEVGSGDSDFMNLVGSCCEAEYMETTKEDRLVCDLEPELLMPNCDKLVNVLEDASSSWGSSIVADVDKLLVCGGSSSRDDVGGLENQVSGSLCVQNLIGKGSGDIKKELLCDADAIAACVPQRLELDDEETSAPSPVLTDRPGMQFGLLGGKNEDPDCSLNIVVLGKTGVGKSTAINCLLGEQISSVDPFHPGTTCMKEILGTVKGVKLRILDTPGLRVFGKEQALNRKMLSKIKNYTREFPPDIVLYVDRLDSAAYDHNDRPILQMITRMLGSSIWEKAIVALSHAASYLSQDSSHKASLSLEAFVARQLEVFQSCINCLSGQRGHVPPVFLFDDNSHEDVLPYGKRWREQLLLLCCSMKFMAEASLSSGPENAFCNSPLFGVQENESEMNRHHSKTGITYVPHDNIIFDVPVDSSIYAKQGKHKANSFKLGVRHLGKNTRSDSKGETCHVKSCKFLEGEENADDHDSTSLSNASATNKAKFIELRGDLTVRANVRSGFSLGHSKIDILGALKDERRWKITIRPTSSGGLLGSVFGLMPVAVLVFQSLLSHSIFRNNGSGTLPE